MAPSSREKRPSRPYSSSSWSRTTDFEAKDYLHVSNIQEHDRRHVFKVNSRHIDTVGQLKDRIFSRHGYSVSALSYRGVPLADKHKLAYLIPDLQPMGAPRFSACTRWLIRPKPGEMCLYVKGLQGAYFPLHLPGRSTVAELMAAILNYEAYPPDKGIVITCGGKSYSTLDSRLALAKCNIVSGSTVYVLGKLLGGDRRFPGRTYFDRQDLHTLKTIRLIDYRSGDPTWRIVHSGLSVTGRCQNRYCEAFDRTVYCGKGFAVFNINEAVHCLVCKSVLTGKSVGFRKCRWMFEGRRRALGSSGSTAKDMMSKWLTNSIDKEFQCFSVEGRNMAEWCSLVITARPLPLSSNPKSKLDTKYCGVCSGRLNEFPFPSNVDMTCDHRMHPACDTDDTTCLACRDPIAPMN